MFVLSGYADQPWGSVAVAGTYSWNSDLENQIIDGLHHATHRARVDGPRTVTHVHKITKPDFPLSRGQLADPSVVESRNDAGGFGKLLCCDMLEPTLMPWPANACKYWRSSPVNSRGARRRQNAWAKRFRDRQRSQN